MVSLSESLPSPRMVTTPLIHASSSPRLLYTIASVLVHGGRRLFAEHANADANVHILTKRAKVHGGKLIAFAILIPVLVLLSGLFAGLTLGYMSLDETQLNVLALSGTPKQKEYAKKIQPIRKNGHLLLITLILANMIVNETLPVISDPVLGGGAQSVVVSTVLIVIFSEIIPQSLCTRYGLAIGAHMAWFVRILIYVLGIVSWPVAKLLEFLLGSHHGIMYRRAELKELIAMHSTLGELGGDLNTDTVTIIGATLDLQEKVVRQAMTPIDKVFMLSIESKLDYSTMKQIYETGHSRIPIYEEVEVPIISEDKDVTANNFYDDLSLKTRKVKKIIGILLVKQCLLIDPKDATPIRSFPLNKVRAVPNNFPLLGILDRFQEGRSHMAIVSRYSEEKAASVKHEVKKGLTRRLKDRVGMGDSSDSSSDESEDEGSSDDGSVKDATLGGDVGKFKRRWGRKKQKKAAEDKETDLEKGNVEETHETKAAEDNKGSGTVQGTWAKITSVGREQSMPDDAVLDKDGAKEFLQSFDPYVMPVGIITLEDVLEELIGEEIYDEFDPEGESHRDHLIAPSKRKGFRQDPHASTTTPLSPDVTPTVVSTSPQAVSPALSAVEINDVSRTPSLAPSLSALVSQKQVRSRSRQRLALNPSDTDVGGRSGGGDGAPRPGTIGHVKEEEESSIPGEKDKHAPDIAKDGHHE